MLVWFSHDHRDMTMLRSDMKALYKQHHKSYYFSGGKGRKFDGQRGTGGLSWQDSVLHQAMASGGLAMDRNVIKSIEVAPFDSERAVIAWLEWFTTTRDSEELRLVTKCYYYC